MDSRTFGSVTLTMPALDEPGLYLSSVESLERGRGIVQDFQYVDARLRSLDLVEAQLVNGRITGLRTPRAQLQQMRLNSVEFEDCDLGFLTWRDSKLSRVVFRNCKVMGAGMDPCRTGEIARARRGPQLLGSASGRSRGDLPGPGPFTDGRAHHHP